MRFSDRLKGIAGPDRHSVDMSAHWGEGAVLYSLPLTARDITKITRKHKNFQAAPTLEAMIDVLIMKAEDEAGDKFFTIEDRPELMGQDLSIVSKAFVILGDVEIDDEEVGKN